MNKYLLILFLLVFSNANSQEITKHIDNFRGDTVYSLVKNKLDGGSFWGITHCAFNVINKNDSTSFVELIFVTPDDDFILSSLNVKVDTKITELEQVNSTDYDIGGNEVTSFVRGISYFKIDKEMLVEMSKAKAVFVRLGSINGDYLDFNFDEDNFKWMKKFVKKINKVRSE